jgi:outer membrane lipoprotein-sorting protein
MMKIFNILYLFVSIFLVGCGFKNAEECIAESSKTAQNNVEKANIVKYCKAEFPKKNK